MKKKISVILFAFILCLSIVFPAFAAETDGFADEYYRVIDMSNLLTDNEETALNAKLDEISIRQQVISLPCLIHMRPSAMNLLHRLGQIDLMIKAICPVNRFRLYGFPHPLQSVLHLL